MTIQKLFLVDDDTDDQEIFGNALRSVDATIILQQAFNGEQALERLVMNEVNPDVIFLDLNMPVMNGIQCLEQIKTNPQLASIPVIIYTTTADPSVISKVISMGAAQFYTKPEKMDELVYLLKKVLDSIHS